MIYVKIISEKVMFYIYSGSTERFYNTRQHVNCESENVIYLVICKNFKIQYVGMLVLLPVNIRSDSVALLQNTRPFRGFRFFSYRVFSLTWSASMQIYWNKRKRLHKKRVQLPQDWFGTPTWPPFHCFGTPRWPP